MPPQDRERLLAAARELEARDAAIARGIEEVGELQRETARVRARAAEIDAFLQSLPERRSEAARRLSEVQAELDEKRDALERARRELVEAERAGKDERLAAARSAFRRAEDSVALRTSAVARVTEQAQRLEDDAEAMTGEARRLEHNARELAERLRRLPRISGAATADPESSLAGVLAWGGRARAALFVVRGSLDSEREAVVREVNELASSVLGEPIAAASASLVRRRIEAALAS